MQFVSPIYDFQKIFQSEKNMLFEALKLISYGRQVRKYWKCSKLYFGSPLTNTA